MHRELRFLKNNIYFASMIFENRGLRKSALAGDCRGSRGEEVKRWPYKQGLLAHSERRGYFTEQNTDLSKWASGNFSVKITSLRAEQIVLRPCCL